MKTQYIYSIILAGAALCSPSAMGQNPMTIEDIIAQIESNNLSLRSQAAANKAEIAELEAGNIVGPTSIEYSPFFRSGITGVASSELIVKQEFDFPTQYSSRTKITTAKGASLDAALSQQRRTLRIEATQACIDWVGAQKRIAILQDRLALTDTLLDLYQQKYDLRSATLLDINRIKLSRVDVKREIAQIQTEAHEAASTIAILNGGNSIVMEGLEYSRGLQYIPLPVSARDYASASVNVAAAEADIRASEAELKMAKKSWLPTIGVGYRRNTDGPESSNGFVIGLDFPIFGIGRQKKAAEARKAAAEISLLEADKEAEAEAETILSRLKMIRATMDLEDIPLLLETIDLYTKSLKSGQITLTDYYQETESLFERLLTQARLEQDYRRLAATLLP